MLDGKAAITKKNETPHPPPPTIWEVVYNASAMQYYLYKIRGNEIYKYIWIYRAPVYLEVFPRSF
jgi:hypothetical protein